jgi:proteasome assembly chaperone (PAC2) family protein
MSVKLLNKDNVRVPVLIAGWPGMGHVGIGAADYLRQKLNASLFARIDVSSYLAPEAIDVEKGLGRIPDPPKQDLYYVVEPALFIFEGDTQPGGEAGLRLADELITLVQGYGTETIYTGAAYALPISFRKRTEVYGVATDERLKSTFPLLGVEPLNEGRISGLNGLLLGLAARRGIQGACFLATMPHYAIETPNPRASRALIEVFQRILNTTVDMTEIEEAVRETDKMLKDFEEKVSTAIQQLKENLEGRKSEEGEGEEQQPEPHQLMERVEKMFEEAQRDKTKAVLLKQELDRWGLFHLYEDRFLDLFERKAKDPRK